MEKYGTGRQATCDSITRFMRFAWWVSKATHTHTHAEYVVIIALPLETVVTRTCQNVTSYVHFLSCHSSSLSITCIGYKNVTLKRHRGSDQRE